MDLRRWWKTLQFLWYFHFHPNKRHDPDPVIQGMKQASIDKTLADFAWKFLRECRGEERYQEKYGKDGYKHRGQFPIQPGSDEFDYKETMLRVWWSKSRFWRAHGLAKWAGFEVRPEVKDYLNRTLLLDIQIREARGCY